MSLQRLVAVIALTAMTTGCHSFGIFAKRESESNCPTDIRKTVPWCAGEDAIFVCPCGPNGNFYGHRPTCWRDWPTSAAAWRDMSCGPTVVVEASEPNPFRGPQPTPALAPTPAPAPTELPTPAPMPNLSPFGLPPLPEAPAPANDADTEKLGPPVLPPSTSTKQHDATPVAMHRGSSASHMTSPAHVVNALKDNAVAPVAIVPAAETPAVTVASNDFLAPSSRAAAAEGEPSVAAPADQNSVSANHPTQSVTSSEYLETENKLQVITAAEPQVSSVEQSGHESEMTEPAAGRAPKFVRPRMGYGFIR